MELYIIICLTILSITGWYMFIRTIRENGRLRDEIRRIQTRATVWRTKYEHFRDRTYRLQDRKPIPQFKTPKMRDALERAGLSKRQIQEEYERKGEGKVESIW